MPLPSWITTTPGPPTVSGRPGAEVWQGDIRHDPILSWSGVSSRRCLRRCDATRPAVFRPLTALSTMIPCPPIRRRSLDLGSQARRHPETTAVIMGGSGETLSYREMNDGSNRFARLLRHRGLRTAGTWPFSWRTTSAIWSWRGGPSAQGSTTRPSTATFAAARSSTSSTTAAPPRSSRRRPWPRPSAALDLGRVPVRLVVGGALPGFDSYESAAAPFEPSPPRTTNPRDGRCSTRRARPASPKVCARPCRHRPRSTHGGPGPDRLRLGLRRRRARIRLPVAGAPLPFGTARLLACRCSAWGRPWW